MRASEYTWQHVQQAPDDGKRREAIGGDLYVAPAPSVRHQRVSKRLERRLLRLLEDPGHGELLHAPIGVEFPETGEGVQPDIVFVSHERRGIVAEDWVVDPEEDAFEVWRFGGSGAEDETTHERHTDRQPVRVHGERVGEIDLEEVFSRGA